MGFAECMGDDGGAQGDYDLAMLDVSVPIRQGGCVTISPASGAGAGDSASMATELFLCSAVRLHFVRDAEWILSP